MHETITHTLEHSELSEALVQQMRELSAHTVIFHHFVGECLLNPTDHKCPDLAEETGLTTGVVTGVMD